VNHKGVFCTKCGLNQVKKHDKEQSTL
jgi:hypothetical protein